MSIEYANKFMQMCLGASLNYLLKKVYLELVIFKEKYLLRLLEV